MMTFWNGTKREGKNREESSGLSLLDSAPPAKFVTDDSGQVLALAPSRPGIQLPQRLRRINKFLPLSRERPKLIGKARPATHGIRASTKYHLKVTEPRGKVNVCKHPKNAHGVSVFLRLAQIDTAGNNR
jgi:hypothetical protein